MSAKGGFDLGAVSEATASGLNNLWAKPQRSRTIVLSALAGVVFIIFHSLVLAGRAAVLVLDKPSQHFVYPFITTEPALACSPAAAPNSRTANFERTTTASSPSTRARS